MLIDDNEQFLRCALALRMIDLKQFNEAFELWEKNKSEDSGQILLKMGFITEKQYQQILDNIVESKARQPESGSIPEIEYSENFELRRIIGQGGAGRVFLAFDRSIGREVAIKEVLPAKQEEVKDRRLKRFIREAKISGQLTHPGVVPVYELTKKSDGAFFYAMKYVQGKTLLQAIMECVESDPLESFKKRIKLLDSLINVAEAMGYAHSKGIIHRDLKPSNIILGEFGETVILDWGLAKRIDEKEEELPSGPISSRYLEDEKDEGLTREGAWLGTPSYMSPEQIDRTLGKVDFSTDVYTLGVILFMILTGTKPYPGKGVDVIKLIIEAEGPPSPRSLYAFRYL
jgi:serine/threonine protein kinase